MYTNESCDEGEDPTPTHELGETQREEAHKGSRSHFAAGGLPANHPLHAQLPLRPRFHTESPLLRNAHRSAHTDNDRHDETSAGGGQFWAQDNSSRDRWNVTRTEPWLPMSGRDHFYAPQPRPHDVHRVDEQRHITLGGVRNGGEQNAVGYRQGGGGGSGGYLADVQFGFEMPRGARQSNNAPTLFGQRLGGGGVGGGDASNGATAVHLRGQNAHLFDDSQGQELWAAQQGHVLAGGTLRRSVDHQYPLGMTSPWTHDMPQAVYVGGAEQAGMASEVDVRVGGVAAVAPLAYAPTTRPGARPAPKRLSNGSITFFPSSGVSIQTADHSAHDTHNNNNAAPPLFISKSEPGADTATNASHTFGTPPPIAHMLGGGGRGGTHLVGALDSTNGVSYDQPAFYSDRQPMTSWYPFSGSLAIPRGPPYAAHALTGGGVEHLDFAHGDHHRSEPARPAVPFGTSLLIDHGETSDETHAPGQTMYTHHQEANRGRLNPRGRPPSVGQFGPISRPSHAAPPAETGTRPLLRHTSHGTTGPASANSEPSTAHVEPSHTATRLGSGLVPVVQSQRKVVRRKRCRKSEQVQCTFLGCGAVLQKSSLRYHFESEHSFGPGGTSVRFSCRAKCCSCAKTPIYKTDPARSMHELRMVRKAAKQGLIPQSLEDLQQMKAQFPREFHQHIVDIEFIGATPPSPGSHTEDDGGSPANDDEEL